MGSWGSHDGTGLSQVPAVEGHVPTEEEQEEQRPVELTFQEHYGCIRTHLWFGDDMLLIGFASGVPLG